jgi:hypothetical protein
MHLLNPKIVMVFNKNRLFPTINIGYLLSYT